MTYSQLLGGIFFMKGTLIKYWLRNMMIFQSLLSEGICHPWHGAKLKCWVGSSCEDNLHKNLSRKSEPIIVSIWLEFWQARSKVVPYTPCAYHMLQSFCQVLWWLLMVPQTPQVVQCRKTTTKRQTANFQAKDGWSTMHGSWTIQLPLQIPHIDKIPPGPSSNQEMMDTSWWVLVCRLASFWALPYRIHGTAFLGFSSAKGLGFPPSNPWLLWVACAVSPPRKNDTRVLGNVIFVDFFCEFPFPQWICHMATSLQDSDTPVKLAEKSPASCAVSQARRVIFRCLTVYMYCVCKLKVISKIYTVCINVWIYLIYLCISVGIMSPKRLHGNPHLQKENQGTTKGKRVDPKGWWMSMSQNIPGVLPKQNLKTQHFQKSFKCPLLLNHSYMSGKKCKPTKSESQNLHHGTIWISSMKRITCTARRIV